MRPLGKFILTLGGPGLPLAGWLVLAGHAAIAAADPAANQTRDHTVRVFEHEVIHRHPDQLSDRRGSLLLRQLE